MVRTSRSLAALAICLSTAALSVACGGDDDDAGAAAGTGGSGATAGTAGTAGVAGTAGTAGTGGSNAGTGGGGTGGGGTGGGGTGGGGTGGGGTGGGGTGGGGTAGVGGSGGSPNCIPVEVTGFTAADNGNGLQFSGSITPLLSGDDADTFSVQFYGTNLGLDPLVPGTFDLTAAPDDNYATCAHCVLVYTQPTDANATPKAFFQTAGTMDLTKISDPVTLDTAASLTGLVLSEVTIDQNTFESTPVSGGTCLSIASFSFDTSPVCGNGTLEGSEGCDDGNSANGDGCSSTCTPEFDVLCANTDALILGDNNGDNTSGASGFVDTCQPNAGTTSLYTYTPAADGVLTLIVNSDADLGVWVASDCADLAMTELGCADSKLGGNAETLQLAVTGGQALTIGVTGYTSADVGAFTLSADLAPPPVCGNGTTEFGEECDDGDMIDDNACTNACTNNVAFLCTQFPTLMAGDNNGDTSMGSSLLSSSCSSGGGLAFRFTPAASGMATFTLSSDSDQGVSVRSDCVDVASELGCVDDAAGGTDEVLSVAVTQGTTYTVLVQAYLPGNEGLFTLNVNVQ